MLALRTVSNAFFMDVLPAGVPTVPVAPDFGHVAIDPATGATIITDEVIACFAPATSFGTISTIGNSFGATVVGRFSGLGGNCYQFGLPQDSTVATIYGALSVLKSRPEVTAAEPDVVRDNASFPCADPA